MKWRNLAPEFPALKARLVERRARPKTNLAVTTGWQPGIRQGKAGRVVNRIASLLRPAYLCLARQRDTGAKTRS